MCAMQRGPYPNQPWNHAPPQLPQQPTPRYRFRWPVYFWLPIILMASSWFLSGIDIPFSFSDITRYFHIHNTERYELLASLGILCVTILLILRVLGK
jgi:hypothetical protein